MSAPEPMPSVRRRPIPGMSSQPATAAPSPPPHGNFATTPTVYRGPYEYSLPGRENDFTMQSEPMRESDRKAYEAAAAVH